MSDAVQVDGLGKTFLVPEREAGLRASVRSLFRRRQRPVVAVAGVSFQIEPGEVVGFLGPNGAGKTTTLKMLAGLLHPTAGEARVLGFVPHRREAAFLRQIALLMGNRQQLVWDLPASDSFEIQRAIYRIPREIYHQTLAELTDLLDLRPLLGKPVRTLSLGERMKCEVAAALLHQPRVLFLDEPTLGLDVTMQRRLRTFLQTYHQRLGATILLTSHAMADVEALCERVIVIHRGHLLYDGALADLVARFAPHKTIAVELDGEGLDLRPFGEIVATSGTRVTLRVPKAEVARTTERLLANLPVLDLTVAEPPIEEVIDQVFATGAAAPGSGRAVTR